MGESIVDLGAAGTVDDLSVRLGLALLGGFTVAVCFWWLYFDVVSIVAARVLRDAHGLRRTTLARDSYTYIHLLFVGGIVFAAMGLKLLVGEEHVDAGRYALDGGIALYLFGHTMFRLRNLGSLNRGRVVAMVIALALIPLTAPFAPLAQLLLPAILLGALVGWEVWAFRVWRAEVRHSETIEA